jgi:hypothetical protein
MGLQKVNPIMSRSKPRVCTEKMAMPVSVGDYKRNTFYWA